MVHFRFPIDQLPSALQDFASEMETIVDQVFHKSESKDESGVQTSQNRESGEAHFAFTPPMDIYETEMQYNVYMDLPGVKPEAVKIEIQDERLVVSGTRDAAVQGQKLSVHRQERAAGKFSRSLRLPKKLDAEKIEARFDNGVLHVVLPKQAKPIPRTIEIKTTSP
jgi:HSP20 family protein